MPFVAIGYAFIVGFVRIQFAAVYSLAEVLAPIAVFGYILSLGRSEYKGSLAAHFRMVRDRGRRLRLVPVFYHSAVGCVLG